MKNFSRIFTCCRIEGRFGPLVANRAVSPHTYGHLKIVNSRLLIFVPVDSEIALDEQTIDSSKEISCQHRLIL